MEAKAGGMKPHHIALTGAHGFIGSHVQRRAGLNSELRVVPIGRPEYASIEALTCAISPCQAVIHLAAMNRGDDEDIRQTNLRLTEMLCQALAQCETGRPHLILASTVLRTEGSAYGASKRAAEQLAREYAARYRFPLSIMVIPNVFGPGCRPFYNSVIATFCHQLARRETPQIIQDRELGLVFVDKLAEQLVQRALGPASSDIAEITVTPDVRRTVSELLQQLRQFQQHYFGDGTIPDLATEFDRQLYATFLSHVAPADHCHTPRIHADDRGSLFEIIRTAGGGQVFFSTTRPGVIRGNHFHTRKVEWFCVLRGQATIRLRQIGDKTVHEFHVSGDQPKFISIPAYYTHHIENTGSDDLLTMFWSSELFTPEDADTYWEKVA